MKTQNIYNLIIIDESGSMESIKHSTISGFREISQTIWEMEKEYPEQRHYISLVYFNSLGIRTVINKRPAFELHEINPDHYRPNSGTPLYDAIGHSVSRLRDSVPDEENARFLVTILTDGEENSSREYRGAQIKAMIKELNEKGWTFTYIGANHDVEKVAFSLSIENSLTFTANADKVNEMFIKEKSARMNYSKKLRDNEDVRNNYFEEDKDSL